MATATRNASERTLRRPRACSVDEHGRAQPTRVRIDRQIPHAKYGKSRKRRSFLHVHDEKNEAKAGDTVEIMECRPISKTKSWRLVKIIKRGELGPRD